MPEMGLVHHLPGEKRPVAARRHVVLLLHGIRTQGEWAQRTAAILESEPTIRVRPVRYGFFDLIRFLVPLSAARERPIKRISSQLRDELSRKPEHLSVIAHSFGTYIVMKILEREPDIRFHMLILCGSIVPEDFPWSHFKHRLGPDSGADWQVLNDCGMQDMWPVIANSVTWGYGSSGRFGFGDVRVKDRFFNAGHSDFFKESFVKDHWLPYLSRGTITEGVLDRATNPWWVSVLTVLKLRYLFILLMLAGSWPAGRALADWSGDARNGPPRADMGSGLSDHDRQLLDSMREEISILRERVRELTPEQEDALKDEMPDIARNNSPGKLWRTGSTVRIRFLDGNTSTHAMVKAIASEWTKHANVRFDFVSTGEAEVRVKFDEGNGAWSFLGTDALGIPKDIETMNLAFWDRATVLHEFGHVLGLIEEHRNPKANIPWNREVVIRELSGSPNFWDTQTIERTIFSTVSADQLPPYRDFDPKSIMNKTFPPDWTGGIAIGGNEELSESDKSFIGRLYPP